MKPLRQARSALLLAILALGLAPPAAAHAVPADLTLAQLAAPVPFAPGSSSASVVFEYRCSGFSADNTAGPQAVSFAIAQAPEWLEASVEPSRIEMEPCRAIGLVLANLTLSARNGSLSLPTDKLVLVATWEVDGFVLDLTAETSVATPFVPAFRAVANETERMARPQTPVVFPLRLVNLGNGVTRLGFEIISKEGDANALVPQPVTLQPPGGQSEVSVPVTMLTPYKNGRVTDTTTIVLRITPSSPLDTAVRGEPQEVMFTLHTKGWYAPAPGLLPLAAAAIAAALLARARR